MHTLHKEMEGWVARAVLRYQKMVDERNTKLQERKLAGAKANEHTTFRADEPPRDFSSVVEILRPVAATVSIPKRCLSGRSRATSFSLPKIPLRRDVLRAFLLLPRQTSGNLSRSALNSPPPALR